MRCPAISPCKRDRQWRARPSRAPALARWSRLAAVFSRALARQVLGTVTLTSGDICGWRARVCAIPDAPLRHDALRGLGKRTNIDGAVLFGSCISERYSLDLTRLLIAFELLADTLDCISESGARLGIRNGIQLHRALVEALEPEAEIHDHYRYHYRRDDAGHIDALVRACRLLSGRLPLYSAVKPYALRACALASEVLPLNHEPDPSRRDRALRRWAQAHCVGGHALTWFEQTAAVSAWLTVLAMLAFANDPTVEGLEAIFEAYLPWVSLIGTMLDSASDIGTDAAESQHSYIAHYHDLDLAIARVVALLQATRETIDKLPSSHGHSIVFASMATMYIAKARPLIGCRSASALLIAAGPLSLLLTPAVSIWAKLLGEHRYRAIDSDR